jgi:hypothetical protein
MKYKAVKPWSWFKEGIVFGDDEIAEFDLSSSRIEELVARGVLVQEDDDTEVTFQRR